MKALFAFFLLFTISTSFGQPSSTVVHYTTDDGLSDNRITCITKDEDGFLWIGTWAGLNRFDGKNFVTYPSTPGTNNVLNTNRIDRIVPDKHGNIWLKSQEGAVHRLDKKTEQLHAINGLRNLLPGKALFNYVIPADDHVWLMTPEHGFFYVKSLQDDSLEYHQYCTASAPDYRLPSNNILFFHHDKQNQWWVGTSAGTLLLKPQAKGTYQSKVVTPPTGVGNLQRIAENGGDLWFTSTQGYLVCLSKSSRRFSSYALHADLKDLCIAPGGKTVYSITGNGQLFSLNTTNGAISSYQMAGSQFHAISGDKTGNIWIEPEQNGIIRFDTGTHNFQQYVLQSNPDFFNSFRGFQSFEDNKGRFWAMMKGSGLGYYDSATRAISYFRNSPADPMRSFSNTVHVMYYDPDGVLWVASAEDGIYRIIFHENNFEKARLSASNERSLNEVRGICTDHRNRLWLSNKGGAIQVMANNSEVAVQFSHLPAGGLNHIYCLYEDRKHNIWIGTKGEGLYKAVPQNAEATRFDLQHFKANGQPGAINSNKIYSVLEDKKGRVWVGSFDGGLNLVQENEKGSSFLHEKNGLHGYPQDGFKKIRHLANDSRGRLWIASTGGLLVMTEDESSAGKFRFTPYVHTKGNKGSLIENDIQYLFLDSRNNMWLCTSGGGLNKAVENNKGEIRFERFTTQNGLQSDFIISCVEDAQSRLWLTSPSGLSSFDGQKFRNYNSYDGLTTTGFSEASCARLANGNLVFGTLSGYLIFSPQSVKDHTIKANIALTGLQVDNMSILVGDSSGILPESLNTIPGITLAYHQNILSIDYQVLDFRFQDNGQFAYRLDGFDDDWQTSQNVNRASYTKLPPGRYVFEVKSLNTDRYSNQPVKRLAIHILPPPWRTWWAYLLYLLAAAALLTLVYRTTRTMIRLRHNIAVEKKMAELKLRFFTHISHELRTPLALIQGPVSELAKSPALHSEDHKNIGIAKKNAQRMSRFINQLLDLGKMQQGKAVLHISKTEMAVLARQTTGYFMNAVQEKGIQIIVQATTKDSHAWVDAEKMETVLYNLLGNALKFSPQGSNIYLRIHDDEKPGKLVITVTDEGPGVSEAELEDIFALYYEGSQPTKNHIKGTGIGLALSKEIIDLHHGQLYAGNNPGKGLTVTIVLKKGKDHFASNEAIEEPESSAPEVVPAMNNFAEPSAILVSENNQEKAMVLLVEDNDDMREFLTRQLEASYQVITAANGRIGLQQARSQMPDLVVSDIMMPEMDGIEMLDDLKNDSRTSHIPVVLLTAKYDVASQVEGLQYGADYYIAKPFDTDVLKAAILNLLKQRKKLFYELQQQKTPALEPSQAVMTSPDERFLKDVIGIVENGLSEPEFDIDSIASSVAMSRSAFYKKFKSLSNMAPIEFLNECRMKKAKQLFDEGDRSISSVSISVGFSSTKYFSTSFRKYYQLSPSEYLKQTEPARK